MKTYRILVKKRGSKQDPIIASKHANGNNIADALKNARKLYPNHTVSVEYIPKPSGIYGITNIAKKT